MKQVMNYHKDNGLLNMIGRTDPMISTPRYNGNISSMRWHNDDYYWKRGYKFTYDHANRLTQAAYGEGDALTTHSGRFSEGVQYDAHGNVTNVARYGKISSYSYGLMDCLTLTYDGNRLTGVSETAADYDVTGSFEYKRANGSQYIYDNNGSLVADKSRGIAYIAYDVNNNPSTIYFTNGNETRYLYSATGQKLRVVYYTAMPYITRNFGVQPAELTQGQILYKDSTDYLLGGSLVMKNGRIDKLYFDGGYARAIETGSTTDRFVFYYYNKDHLGNNREVVDAKARFYQVTSYYPFGAPYADPAAVSGADYQPYKYNGKELDLMHGLKTYDYGARQYDPILARWDRMDPLAEKYYGISPYMYCLGNPIKWIDKKGEEPGDPFPSPDAAARDFGMIYNFKSIETNREYGSLIYQYKENGKTLYSYNEPNVGKEGAYRVIPNAKRPINSITYGDIHTHGRYNGNEDNNNGEFNVTWTFSQEDKFLVNKGKLKASYLCTPEGKLMKYKTNEKGKHCILTFNVDLPSDENSPNHNSNTTASILEKKNKENCLNALWALISKYLK